MKSLQFVNEAAQDETRTLPASIRRSIGYQLWRVQIGEMPADFKVMKSIGAGVYEIRAEGDRGSSAGRCFYVAKFKGTVWVLHSFIKKSRKTSEVDLMIGVKRYKELLSRVE